MIILWAVFICGTLDTNMDCRKVEAFGPWQTVEECESFVKDMNNGGYYICEPVEKLTRPAGGGLE
jgi:hypothetical protein